MSNVLRGTLVNPEKIYGKSAYEIAVMHGFNGTEEEWLDSLVNDVEVRAAQAIADADAKIALMKETSESEIANIEATGQAVLGDVQSTSQNTISHIESLAEGAYDIVQGLGDSENKVMSQKATTDTIKTVSKPNNIIPLQFEVGGIEVDGSNGKRTDRLRTPKIDLGSEIGKMVKMIVPNGYTAWLYWLWYDNSFDRYVEIHNNQFVVEQQYLRVLLVPDGDTVSVADTVGMCLEIKPLVVDSDLISPENHYNHDTVTKNVAIFWSSSGSHRLINHYGTDVPTDLTDVIKIPQNYGGEPVRYIYCCYVNSNGTWGHNSVNILWYDENMTVIDTMQFPIDPVLVPANAMYCRVAFWAGYETYRYISFSNDLSAKKFIPPQFHIKGELLNNSELITNSDGAINMMLRAAMSYAYNAEYGYGSDKTAFNDICEKSYSDYTPPKYQGMRYQIDCSSFAQLCLMGIPSKLSRYENTENLRSRYGYLFNDLAMSETRTWNSNLAETALHNHLYAHKLARYAYENGFLYQINKDRSNVRVGDLVFWCNAAGYGEAGSDFFRDIGHVAIVSQVFDRTDLDYKMIKIFDSTSSGEHTVQEQMLWENSTVKYGARFPMPFVASVIKSVYDAESAENVSATLSANTASTLKTLNLSEDLKHGEIYTLTFRCQVPDNVCFEYHINNHAHNIGTSGYKIKKRKDGLVVVRISIFNNLDIGNAFKNKLDICVKSETAQTVNTAISDIHMYRGYVSIDENTFF